MIEFVYEVLRETKGLVRAANTLTWIQVRSITTELTYLIILDWDRTQPANDGHKGIPIRTLNFTSILQIVFLMPMTLHLYSK